MNLRKYKHVVRVRELASWNSINRAEAAADDGALRKCMDKQSGYKERSFFSRLKPELKPAVKITVKILGMQRCPTFTSNRQFFTHC